MSSGGQLPPRPIQATATPLQGGAAQERDGASNTTKQQGNQPPVNWAAGLRRKATPKKSQAKTGSKDCPEAKRPKGQSQGKRRGDGRKAKRVRSLLVTTADPQR